MNPHASFFTFRLMGALLRRGVARMWEERIWLAIGAGVAVVALLVIHRWDDVWLNQLLLEAETTAWHAAEWISDVGDLPSWPLYASVLLWLAGTLAGRPHWKKLGLVFLLSGAVAGLNVLAMRNTLGRPRPSTPVEDRFYGPTLEYAYSGFPSGHTGAAFGYATAVAVAVPPLAIPAMLGAGTVAWSRMALNCHRPTDVTAAALIGILWGVYLGRAARRLELKPPSEAD